MSRKAKFRGEVWQDAVKVASVESDNFKSVNAETAHYAFMYSQDGKVEVRLYEKRHQKPWVRISG